MEGAAAAAATMAGGKRNKWTTHVRKTMKVHKGKSFGAILKLAKKTYKGGADGAADRTTLSPMPVSTETGALVGGRRRSRKTRKTRKGGRKH